MASYHFSNPYANTHAPAAQQQQPYQQQQAQYAAAPSTSTSRSTFAAGVNQPAGHQVLFAGLPLDVQERDLRELLLNPPLQLAATSTTVRCLYTSDAKFTGAAIVSVGHADDAERLRREYSGQTIDGDFRLTVQHILPATQALPSATVVPFGVSPAQQAATAPAAPVQPRVVAPRVVAPRAQQQQLKQQQIQAQAQAQAQASKQSPGLQLLSRMKVTPAGGVGAQGQSALLAKQKANLRGAPGSPALLARMASNSPGAKAIAKAQSRKTSAATSAQAKVGRAKAAAVGANAGGMEVDSTAQQGTNGKGQLGGKKAQPTAADLDEEMRLYERQKRFAA